MAKMIFLNLPVKDVAKSTAFYEALGFTKDERFSNEVASGMNWSDEIKVMILGHEFYQTFIPHKQIADSASTNEMLIALSFDSRAEVDAMIARAVAAGAKIDIREPQDLGFMYGRTFEDLDGHIFEPYYMDLEAAFASSGQGQPD